MITLPEFSIVIFLLFLNFAVFSAVIFTLVSLKSTLSKEKKAIEREAKAKEEVFNNVDRALKTYFDSIFGNSGKRIEHEVDKFSEEMGRLMHAKSSELAAFIEKAQQDQVKESQFFVANMLSKIEKDAEEYRQNKLKKVDEQIREIVQSAAREVIGRAISLSEHEDLVVKALERAKRDKVFG